MHFSKHYPRALLTIVATIEMINGMLEDKNPSNQSGDLKSVIHNRLKPSATKPSVNWTQNNLNSQNEVVLTPVENAINHKIEELKSCLQDYDIINDAIKIQDDTTIIELPSKGKDGLREMNGQTKDDEIYKRLRKKVDKALRKEFISDKTHDLIIKTVDSLIARVRQCNWKDKDTRISTSKMLTNLWNEEWKHLKIDYLEKIKLKHKGQVREMTSFFDGLYTFFSFIIKDMGILSNKYNIKCISTDKPIYRKHEDFEYDSESDVHGKDCNRFFICSKELKNFMLDFYNFINDTTVSVIRNYAEMYIRDTDNFSEKHKIVSSINTTSVQMEAAIVDIFTKQTTALQLDSKKNKENNIKKLSNYVRATIAEVNKKGNDYLNKELRDTKASLSSGIKADLNANLKIDLENLQREVLGRICFIFRFCNGKYRGRRNRDVNDRNIYHKIESEIKEFFNLTNFRRIFDIKSDKKRFGKHYATMNVTRTTPFRDFHSNSNKK